MTIYCMHVCRFTMTRLIGENHTHTITITAVNIVYLEVMNYSKIQMKNVKIFFFSVNSCSSFRIPCQLV